MKLHLPITLFAALMAVLTTLPTYADYTLKIGDDTIDVSDWDGQLYVSDNITQYTDSVGSDSYIGEKVTLTITNENGKNTVTFIGQSLPYNGYQSTNNLIFQGGTSLEIGSGCTFVIAGAGQVVGGRRTGSNTPLVNNTEDNVIDLYGTIKASDNPHNSGNHSYYSELGHLFHAYGGTGQKYGLSTGRSDDCVVAGTLNIHSGGLLDAESGGTLVVSEVERLAQLTATINVYEGGTIRAGKDKLKIGFIYNGDNYRNSSDTPIATTILTLDGGTVEIAEGTRSETEKANSIGYCAYAGAKTDTTIHVLNKGKFQGGGVAISTTDWQLDQSGLGSNTDLSIIVEGAGSEFSTNGNISYSQLQNCSIDVVSDVEKNEYAGDLDQVHKNAEIRIADGGTMTFGGSYMGAQRDFYMGYRFYELHFSTRIVVESGGIFTITGKPVIGVKDSLIDKMKECAEGRASDTEAKKPEVQQQAQGAIDNMERYTLIELHGEGSTVDLSGITGDAAYYGIWAMY